MSSPLLIWWTFAPDARVQRARALLAAPFHLFSLFFPSLSPLWWRQQHPPLVAGRHNLFISISAFFSLAHYFSSFFFQFLHIWITVDLSDQKNLFCSSERKREKEREREDRRRSAAATGSGRVLIRSLVSRNARLKTSGTLLLLLLEVLLLLLRKNPERKKFKIEEEKWKWEWEWEIQLSTSSSSSSCL